MWRTPEQWVADFLNAPKMNQEVRDKQRHLFKRPRNFLKYAGAGTINVGTSWAAIDAVGFLISFESTGRPILLTLGGGLTQAFGGAANHFVYFDIKTNGGLYASTEGYGQKAEGAYQVCGQNTSQNLSLNGHFIFSSLPAGVHTFTPFVVAPATGNSFVTNNSPLWLTVEEL